LAKNSVAAALSGVGEDQAKIKKPPVDREADSLKE
jgi:hypothetical protein